MEYSELAAYCNIFGHPFENFFLNEVQTFSDVKTFLEGKENGVAYTERFMQMSVPKDDGTLAEPGEKIKFMLHIKNCNKSPIKSETNAHTEEVVIEPAELTTMLTLHGKSHNILYALDPTYYGPGLIDGRFSAFHFDLETDQWKYKPSELIHKVETLNENPAKTFRRDLKRFSKEISQRLFKIYKWEIPVSTAYVVATMFTAKFPQLESIYQRNKHNIFSAKAAPVDLVDLLKDMIKNSFKYRSMAQKKQGNWPIRTSTKVEKRTIDQVDA